MSDPLDVSAHEVGTTRVFVADADPDAGNAPMTNDEAAKLLGGKVDPAKVEVVPAGSLTGMGLSGYLVEGYGIDAGDIEGDRAMLDGLDGQIVLVPSSATGGAATLDPQPPLRFVGLYREPAAAPHEVMTSSSQPEPSVETERDGDASGGGSSKPERKVPVGPIVVVALVIAAILVLLS